MRCTHGVELGGCADEVCLKQEGVNRAAARRAHDSGEALAEAQRELVEIGGRYREAGVTLEILGAGTTGYGELLLNKAFKTEYHVVETVAHARAVEKYVKDATFILDIGGQDMKAIWLDNGIITNILLNESCSSRCGSLLQLFAPSPTIPGCPFA